MSTADAQILLHLDFPEQCRARVAAKQHGTRVPGLWVQAMEERSRDGVDHLRGRPCVPGFSLGEPSHRERPVCLATQTRATGAEDQQAKRAWQGEPRLSVRNPKNATELMSDYHGADAEYLKVQALQLLLRLQVQALKKLWNLPDIFEVRSYQQKLAIDGLRFESVVRDIWAYQLAITSDLEGGPGTARPAADEPAVSDNEKSAGQPLEEPDEDSSGEGNESQLSKTDTEDEDGVDPDILAELSDTSSKASDIGDASLPQAGKQSDTLREKKRRLRVSDTLSVVLLGLWILRIPILFADMEK